MKYALVALSITCSVLGFSPTYAQSHPASTALIGTSFCDTTPSDVGDPSILTGPITPGSTSLYGTLIALDPQPIFGPSIVDLERINYDFLRCDRH